MARKGKDKRRFDMSFSQKWIEEILRYPDVKIPNQSFAVASEDLLTPVAGFWTLDPAFAAELSNLSDNLRAYLSELGRRRPHNVLMMAAPGSGKSHLVSCLARAIEAPLVTGNLSSVDISETLQYVINEARNYKAVDAIPVLFLDESDSKAANLPVLLPLLWDGEFFARGQHLKIGRCIVICAISDPDLIGYVTGAGDPGVAEAKYGKLADFVSRFSSTFVIPSINEDRRRHDKAWLGLELLWRRFKDIRVDGIPAYFVQFIERLTFLHEIRSLEALLGAIPRSAVRNRRIETSGPVPLLVVDAPVINLFRSALAGEADSALRYHISGKPEVIERLEKCRTLKGFEGIVWREPAI